jgi:hypothetical protein
MAVNPLFSDKDYTPTATFYEVSDGELRKVETTSLLHEMVLSTHTAIGDTIFRLPLDHPEVHTVAELMLAVTVLGGKRGEPSVSTKADLAMTMLAMSSLDAHKAPENS